MGSKMENAGMDTRRTKLNIWDQSCVGWFYQVVQKTSSLEMLTLIVILLGRLNVVNFKSYGSKFSLIYVTCS